MKLICLDLEGNLGRFCGGERNSGAEKNDEGRT